jgi:uncharacterized protein (UPF0332 family)
VKPESVKFIEQANIMLTRADIMLSAGLNEDAAREAYLASFHTAQAYIFERTDKTFKTHRGVQSEFFRLTRHDARTDQDLRRFLAQSYEFKSVADYFSGPSPVTSRETAAEAIATARRFVEHFTRLVPPPISTSRQTGSSIS